MAKKTQDWNKTLKEPEAAKAKRTDRPLLALNIPRPLVAGLWELSVRLGTERGRRVTVTALVTEAIEDLLKKHRAK